MGPQGASVVPPGDRAGLVSVVVPVFNEKTQLAEFKRRLVAGLVSIGNPWEVWFVDDGSTDGSDAEIRKTCGEDKRFRLLRFSRNFGHQLALTAGLDHAEGECVVTLDSDLQHPPELIGELVRFWKEGHAIVYTSRTDTAEASWFKRATSNLYYKLFHCLSEVPMEANTADFRLMDKSVVNVFRRMRERHRFIRGMVTWVGFSKRAVPFTADKRYGGASKYSLWRMVAFALDGLISFSSVPLKLSIMFGLGVCLVSGLYGLFVLYEKLVLDIAVPGWTSILLAVIILGSMQLMTIGIAGLYIGRIYEESKGRPLYIVEEMVSK